MTDLVHSLPSWATIEFSLPRAADALLRMTLVGAFGHLAIGPREADPEDGVPGAGETQKREKEIEKDER
jgi:hypothetical protein